MKLDRFLQFFVVKERKFYPLFINLAQCAKDAAANLTALVQETDFNKQYNLFKQVKTAEHSADLIADKIYEELKTSFVTPFDREDINALRLTMDNFIDFSHDAAKKIIMYKPHKLNQMFQMMGKYIDEDADLILEIAKNLEFIPKKNELLAKRCDRVHEIEHACDDLYEEIMSDVFTNEKDAIELVRLKNIVQALEDTTDKAKSFIDIVRSILIKFA